MKHTTPISRILCALFATAAAGPAFGQAWVPAGAPYSYYSTSNYWLSIACSADGSKAVVAATGREVGLIFTSDDGGTNWVPTRAPSAGWCAVTSSADGTRLAAVIWGRFGVCTSADSGATWAWHAGLTEYGLASSTDGATLLGTQIDYNAYVSTDYGLTWSTWRTPVWAVNAVACSADGTGLVVGSLNGDITVSTDGGATWSQPVSAGGSAVRVAGSADLNTLIAYETGNPAGSILTSTNMGRSWVPSRVPPVNWIAVAASADGTKLVATSLDGFIYTSSDSGTTWTSNSAPALHWYSVASSADGNALFAASWEGQIWMRRTVPAPALQVAPVGSGLKLSWLVPSATFQLQQTPGLGASDWSDVANQPTLNLTNLDYEVFLPQPPANAFFRLVKR